MASILTSVNATVFSTNPSSAPASPNPIRIGGVGVCAAPSSSSARRRNVRLVARAEGGSIYVNPAIRKDEGKVVDTVVVTELAKPVTAYCRCWRSNTFPLCDGTHVKHNKATGDNVGPLLLKKE
ncbi:CDGSH iron-sulfur domain-containing protein [Drosera capensis]